MEILADKVITNYNVIEYCKDVCERIDYDTSKGAYKYENYKGDKTFYKYLDGIFDNIANDSPQSLIDLMHTILEKLEKTNLKQKMTNVYNLQQRIATLEQEQTITVEEFYWHCMQTECSKDIPFKHPNGWIMSCKPRDMMHYEEKIPYTEPINDTPANNYVWYGKYKNIRFYLNNKNMDYPYEYFYRGGRFWITSGLEYVDFDDCMFMELENVFAWLQSHNDI